MVGGLANMCTAFDFSLCFRIDVRVIRFAVLPSTSLSRTILSTCRQQSVTKHCHLLHLGRCFDMKGAYVQMTLSLAVHIFLTA